MIIRPMGKQLNIKFYAAVPHPEKPVIKSIASGKKFEGHIRMDSLNNIRPVCLYPRI